MVKSLKKNNYLKIAATLFIFILALPGFLSVVSPHSVAKILPKDKSLRQVFPTAFFFRGVTENGVVLYYKAFDRQKNMLGVVFTASKRGYSSDIVTMVGMDTNGTIIRIKILSQDETPGLGAQIVQVANGESEPRFQRQFSGKEVSSLDHTVDAITGATITSKAVIESIQQKAKMILERAAHGA